MAYKGYVNKEVQAMYGIPYSKLTPEQKKILHEDSKRRAKLIKEVQEAVIKNNEKAFEDEAKLEKVLGTIYRNAQKKILADVTETIAKVKKDGGTWSYANQSALTRSRGLFEQITAEINKLGQQEQAVFTQGLGNIYTDQFLRQVYELGQTIPVKANFNRLNANLVKRTLDYPWSGAMFSDRIWQDKAILGKNLREGLTQSMILGEGIPEITERIRKGIDTAKYNAERIARTETKRVAYVAHNDAYEDAGVEELEYYCSGKKSSSHVCGTCKKDDGKPFKRGEEPTLPRHPNCKCTYIPIIKDTFGDNELNELTHSIRGAENYEKWKNSLQKAQKEKKENDYDTVEEFETRISEVDTEQTLWEKKQKDASVVIRGLDEAKNRGFTDIDDAKLVKEEADKKIAELSQLKASLMTKLSNLKKKLIKASTPQITITYSTQKGYYFSDGSGQSVTTKIKDAIIAIRSDGVRIVIPEKLDTKKQKLTIQKVSDLLDTLPEELRKHCKEIQLVDYYNPYDSYWGKRYKMSNFYSYAVGGNGDITFFRNDTHRGSTASVNNSDSWVSHTLCHELGHTVDQKCSSVLGKSSTGYGSDGADYAKAIKEDVKVCGESWASAYGASSQSVHEDFADSMAEFVENGIFFKKKFPNRYKYIEEVLSKL